MNPENRADVFVIVVVSVIVGVLCFITGLGIGRVVTLSMDAKNAIERGHAEWVLKNGGPEVEFRWKEIGKCGLPKSENK